MTRIIAGALGGRRIETPRGARTRPTSERVREAIFSRVETMLDLAGSSVLDLYAGSGALGLEAASRGARRVLLVEADRRVAALVGRSVTQLGLTGVATVRPQRVETVLSEGPGEAPPYDVVLLDPPYPVGEDELAGVLDLLVGRGWLAPGGLVVLERSSRSPTPLWPDGLAPLEPRRYGETTVHFAEPVAPEQ